MVLQANHARVIAEVVVIERFEVEGGLLDGEEIVFCMK
jgi:hypothetical protein